MRKALLVTVSILTILLSACVYPTPTAPATGTPGISTPTTLVIPTTEVPPTQTSAPVITSTAAPATATSAAPTATHTSQPQPSNTPAPSGAMVSLNADASLYIDDRSGISILASLVNAINRHEYLRAYGYWGDNSPVHQNQTYDQYAAGFAQTQSATIQVGKISSEGAAGSIYTSVPVALTATTTANASQYYLGCYTLRLVQPGNFGAPPVHPEYIDNVQIQAVSSAAEQAAGIASVCPNNPNGSLPSTSTPNPNDVSNGRYLDDRSDGIQVVRSYYNAINRHEYARAYGYWEPAAATTQLPSFDQFQQGYQTTDLVDLTFGTQTSDAGAGQLYYAVPVKMVSHLTDSTTNTYVACYTLHLANPGIQATPPFQPLGIRSAVVQQVDNGSDTTALMASICQQ